MSAKNENAGTVGRPSGARSATEQGGFGSKDSTSNGRLEALLSRLERVSRRGDRYRSICPSCGGTNASKLAIRETGDGRILVYCFGGCSVDQIVNAMGLELADLMPERQAMHRATPQELERWRKNAMHGDWRASADELLREASVVLVAAQQLRAGEGPLTDEDAERLDQALSQVARIRERFRA